MTADPHLTRLAEQRDVALGDIRALEAQVEAGELSEAQAEPLRARYEAVAAAALRAVDDYQPSEPPEGRSRTRMALGAVGFLAVAAIVVFTVTSAVEPRPEGGFVTGGVAQDVVEGSGVDLSAVTNEEMEQVVAANPEILPMRLALARRYVEDGQFSEALGHYLFVLERETNAEALMYVGWMTYLSGDAATAATLVGQSLAVAPDEPLAQWFMANILFFGAGDEAGAVPFLESLLDSGTAPTEIEQEARRMLDEATP